MTRHTNDDFERLSWHDNLIYGFHIERGDPDRGRWHSDLVLDIDFIAEWLRGTQGFEFLVAPATLTFHDVTDLKLKVDHGNSGLRTAINEWSIDVVHRATISRDPQDPYPERTYFRWCIALNAPQGGALEFGASGFTQVLRADPVRIATQYLSPTDRQSML